MPAIKTFIHSLRQSIFNLNYYRQVLKAPLSFSVKFFLAFCLIFGLISSFSMSLVVIPNVNKFSTKLQSQIYDLYPPDLAITIKDKKVNINQDVPYFIPINYQAWFNVDVPDSAMTNLLVIDTKSTNPTKDIKQYQTIALLTEDTLALQGDSNEVRTVPLEQIEPVDVVVNQPIYHSFIDKLSPFIKHLSTVVLAAITIFFILFLPVTKLLHLFIFSLVAMLISKWMKPNLSYKQTLQINLHAFVIPSFIVQLISMFVTIPIPFFYSLIFLVYFLLILSKLERPKK